MASIHQQVALIATSTPSPLTAWDVQLGTHIASFKDNASRPNAFSLLGRDYFVAAQQPKGSLNFWTWHKDQVLQRSYAVEPILVLACHRAGRYCAGGGISGAIYLWETGSGRLMKSWPAHYKAVTSLVFGVNDTVLLSGGEDTVVNTWTLLNIFETTMEEFPGSGPFPTGQNPKTYKSWSDHTLPVTGIYCGWGWNASVVTTSLDRKCYIYNLPQGNLLRAISFPVSLHSLVMDAAELSLYLGAADGRVFEVTLAGQPQLPATAAAAAGPVTGSNGVASGRQWNVMEGHSRTVTCMAMAVDGAYMLSGSEDGTVRVWEVRSRQTVRVINSPEKAPVSGLLVLDRPEFLAAGQGRRNSLSEPSISSAAKGPKLPEPLEPFAKFMSKEPWIGPTIILNGSHGYRGEIKAIWEGSDSEDLWDSWGDYYPDDPFLSGGQRRGGFGHSPALPPLRSGVGEQWNTGAGNQGDDMEDLLAENEALRQQLKEALEAGRKWQAMHEQLHSFCVEQLLPGSKD